MKTISDYTHTNITIEDIRLRKSNNKGRGNDFFAIKIEGIDDIVFVNYNIFNDRVKSYFLGKNVENIERNQILDLKWTFRS